MDKNELLAAKREEILQVAARYGAHNVRIFGSVARGDAGPSSDIDFLVDMEPGRSLFDLGGLLMDLQKLLGVEVDIATEKGLRSRIRDRVLGEAVKI
jgi:predicted nucleotidyltransferase